ncbi:MAG: hypothetical protein BroJett010_25550 [Gammaproteobacteria bacterium]|nr:MAG: hypothetical protein BroJett010_25550 [Gammaproteobacteria bacterium]
MPELFWRGTPRIGTDENKAMTWRYQSDAFGVGTPSGTASVRLRLPGQIDLGVLGISYNYFRDYDPQVGRYVESDPIGIEGGLNTYGYVGANPLRDVDPLGLDRTVCLFPSAARGLGHIGIGRTPSTTQGFFPVNPELHGPGAVFPDLQRVDNSDMQCTTVRTTEDQDRRIDKFIADRTVNGGTYNLAFRNCSNFVAGALYAGGISPFAVPATPVPGLLFRYIQRNTPR